MRGYHPVGWDVIGWLFQANNPNPGTKGVLCEYFLSVIKWLVASIVQNCMLNSKRILLLNVNAWLRCWHLSWMRLIVSWGRQVINRHLHSTLAYTVRRRRSAFPLTTPFLKIFVSHYRRLGSSTAIEPIIKPIIEYLKLAKDLQKSRDQQVILQIRNGDRNLFGILTVQWLVWMYN